MTHLLALATVLAALSAPPEALNPRERYEFAEMLMGMQFKLVVYAPDGESANKAAQAAFRRIQELNDVCSDYQADSELSRLCQTAGQGKAVPISEDLRIVLEQSQRLAELSDGAFDPTVGPLTRLWRRSRRSKTLPAKDVLESARAAVGYRHLRLNLEHETAELLLPKMQLDLGGIAVGYAIDEALLVLKSHGITSALIDGSGDIGVSDAPPGTDGWRIGVAPLDAEAEPSRYLVLKNAAVTTSGDAFQFVEIDGVRYSHIVDPKTGLGLTRPTSVTVIARNCREADSYATAVCVLGPKRGLKFIANRKGTEALIVTRVADKTETWESPGFQSWQAK